MVLKLDARFPLVWRSPWDLQFGIDPVRVILRDVTNAEERLIAALTAGISRSGLTMIAESAGATDQQVGTLLRKVSPVLEGPAPASSGGERGATSARFLPDTPGPLSHPPPGTRVDLVGRGPTVERIARVLAQSGLRVVVAPAATANPGVGSAGPRPAGTAPPDGRTEPEEQPAMGIAVGHFVVDPDVYGYWLRRDIPHLPVVFGDSAVNIGPVVEPGTGPCLFCLDRFRSDADPLWPTLATQLWGRRSATETPLVSREAASRAARIVLMRLAAGLPGPAESVRLDAQTGAVTTKAESPHPECGCREIPSAVPSGNDSVAGTDHGDFPRQTTSRRVSGAHE